MAVGVRIIGVRGNATSVSMIGARAIIRGVTDMTGTVTVREPVAALDLLAVDDLVFGSYDIRSQRIGETTEEMAGHDDVMAPDTLDAICEDPREIDERVELGTVRRCDEAAEGMSSETTGEDVSVADIIEEVRADYAAFADSQGVNRLVVVNAASTEPPIPTPGDYDTLTTFETVVERDDPNLPASALYAYMALLDGHPYVNFTPSTGPSLGGLHELAERNEVPHMGHDGKTGEALMKPVLGPIFAGRNLRVLSWEGHNILGNSDGLVLEDDANKAGKIESKGSLLNDILGYETHNAVHIDYTPSLGDWKTMWDRVHLEGLLGTEMKMQFTWEGADSTLVAPLVLDLVRLAVLADERGEGGTMPRLTSLFKSPEGVDRHKLSEQLRLPYDYAERHAGGA